MKVRRVGWLTAAGLIAACGSTAQVTKHSARPLATGEPKVAVPATNNAPASAEAPVPTATETTPPPDTFAEAATTAPTTPPPPPPPPPVFADPAGFQQPWSSTVPGVLTFRGNPTRSFHGTGPMPVAPSILWRYPDDRQMCGNSEEYNETRVWCGVGWTGQPAVFERNGQTWVTFGAYDYDIHFVDGLSGQSLATPVGTNDIAKGSPTVDPDGFPLVYAGSRDNQLRIIAIDRPEPEVLWSLNAADAGEGVWNNDWDGSPLILGDWLIEGGENSRLHAVKLNRGYDANGLVSVAPSLEWTVPGWDQELLDSLPDRRVSLESSVVVVGSTVYVASSGGLVQGWDLSGLGVENAPEPQRTFRFWTGDDTDATIVADAEGYLYVGVEVDRNTARARELGQFIKLDPRQPDEPVVWAIDVNSGVDSGTWSTPAISGETVIWPTKPGTIYGLDRATGSIRWEVEVARPVLSSPAVVDGILVQGDGAGVLHAWSLGDGITAPTPLWSVTLDGNIEATPAIWKGRIYVGSRDGHMYAIGDVS